EIWWILCALFLSRVNLARLMQRGMKRVRDLPFTYSVRMALETLYAGLSGQASVFVLGATAAPADVAGIRLAYTFTYAPATLITQGLHPHVLRRLSQEVDSGRDTLARNTTLWSAATVMLFLLSGLVFAVGIGG